MDLNRTKIIPDFDRKFQYNLLDLFSKYQIPIPTPIKPRYIKVSRQDLDSFASLAFIKKYFVSYSKWCYANGFQAVDIYLAKSDRNINEKCNHLIGVTNKWLKYMAMHLMTLASFLTRSTDEKLKKGSVVMMLAGFEDYLFPGNDQLLDYLIKVSGEGKPNRKITSILIVCGKDERFKYKGVEFCFASNLSQVAMKTISFKDLIISFIETGFVAAYLLKNLRSFPYLYDSIGEYLRSPFLCLGINKYAEDIIVTNSVSHIPPLFAYFKTSNNHLISCLWYSADYFSYRFEHTDISTIPVTSRYFRVDRHFFWTNIQKDFYEKAGYQSEITFSAPVILQRNSKIKFKPLESGEIGISIFNIIPFLREHLANCGNPQEHYINLDRCLLFITDICEVAQELKKETSVKIKIFLKQKRSKGSVHLDAYFNKISELVKSGDIVVLEHNCDMVSLFENTTLSISQPFSTPFFIAKELGHQAYFYDPAEILLPCHTLGDKDLISGREQLKELIRGYTKSVI